jgi:hypothetical protein
MEYIKPERIWLKESPDYSEKWVQSRIAEDPSILGLGDLVLRDKERPQPYAGRLDLLLQDPESDERYEVELQLGATDESHIIRTIEYWDVERKRYPQYEHTAVIVAEDITGRFLNVISLFNGTIPLIAIQLQAVKFGNFVSLVATKVLDRLDRGLEGDDEEVRETTDRSYWEQKSPSGLTVADDLLKRAKELDPSIELKYNKFYLALSKHGGFFNFCMLHPKKNKIALRFMLPENEQLQAQLDAAGLTTDYEKRGSRYRVRLTNEQFKTNTSLLDTMLKAAYANISGQ